MRNIARHIRNYDQPIPTDEWLLQKLAEIGKLDKEHIRIISQMAGISDTAIQRMLEDMAASVVAELEPGYQYLARQGLTGGVVPAVKSRNVKRVMKALRKQARDTSNLVNTTMLYKAKDVYRGLVQDIAAEAAEIAGKQAFIDILNADATAAIIGAESRVQAVRRCIRRFLDKGIPAFVDKRGREWTPEAYINMAMRTTSASVATQVQMARADDHGINLVEVSSHAGARPKCAPYQGRIFDRSNQSAEYPHWNTTSYGEPDGLLGINCGHHIYPYIDGVSIRRHFPTEDMDANNKLYKETQKQRALERAVRKQKRECMLYDELGDKEAFEQAAVKLKAKEAQLKAYVDGNDKLHRRKDREQVVGFDRRVSSEAVSANKAYTKAMNTDTIKIKDTIIHKSAGAKSRNYKVVNKDTGVEYEFAPGTRVQNSEVFAGKGTKHSLHEGVADGLTQQYGGTPSKWQHAKGYGTIVDPESGEEFRAEVHWFQEETVGKVKFKIKREVDDEG